MSDKPQGSLPTGIVPLRRGIVARQPRHPLEEFGVVTHRRYEPVVKPYGDWTAYGSQSLIRSAYVDAPRGLIWLATWGGVLGWNVSGAYCTRHTSEHGLVGNAVSAIAVDAKGWLWAAAELGGMACLDFDTNQPWVEHPGCRNFAINVLSQRDGGGVIAACDDQVLEVPDLSPTNVRNIGGQLATRSVDAILADGAGGFWTGNPWGLHHVNADGTGATIADIEDAVLALARSPDNTLWIGTSAGLYRLDLGTQEVSRHEEWPQFPVRRIIVEDPGSVLVSSKGLCGRASDAAWEPVVHAADGHPEGRLESLAGQVFSIGPQAAYRVQSECLEKALSWTAEDAGDNLVQCLCASGPRLYVGGPGGLSVLDGDQWRQVNSPRVRDVRGLLPGNNQRLWAATMPGGLRLIDGMIDVPGDFPDEPAVTLCEAAAGAAWAAGPQSLFYRDSQGAGWMTVVSEPACLGNAVIHALFAWQAQGHHGVLVGTSAGLWSYKHDLALWKRLPVPSEATRIHTIVRDESTGLALVGSTEGLFCLETGQRICRGDVRAVLFDDERGSMWIGTANGLHRWRTVPSEPRPTAPEETFHAGNSGLAANRVNALALRTIDGTRELWVGTSGGLSSIKLD